MQTMGALRFVARRWQSQGTVARSTSTGAGVGVAVVLPIAADLLSGPGATWRLLLPALLLLLPLAGAGAALGYAVGLLLALMPSRR